MALSQKKYLYYEIICGSPIFICQHSLNEKENWPVFCFCTDGLSNNQHSQSGSLLLCERLNVRVVSD